MNDAVYSFTFDNEVKLFSEKKVVAVKKKPIFLMAFYLNVNVDNYT